MRKFWKKALALCLIAGMLSALCGCNALDELRASQGYLQEDGTILWNGVVYKLLPDSELLYAEPDYAVAVNVTAPDVPVLASALDAQITAFPTKDRKFLINETDYNGYTAYYCCAADYDAMVQRLTGEFVPEMVCFFYMALEEEVYVTKHYTLTDTQLQALAAVTAGIEPKPVSQVGMPTTDAEIHLYGCSKDLLLQKCDSALGKTGNQYFLEVFLENDTLLYPIPASQNPVIDEIFKAYEDAMWAGMGME